MTPTQIVFETHSWSEDNDAGRATGWNHGALSPKGRELAAELGSRRRVDGLDLVLVSDLRRAVETAEIAFAESEVPVLHDWRLRECNFGELNGQPTELVHATVTSVEERYAGGESWADAVGRVHGVLGDIGTYWPGLRVLVIGHMSTYWALEHYLRHRPLESIGRDFRWQEGWEYEQPVGGDA